MCCRCVTDVTGLVPRILTRWHRWSIWQQQQTHWFAKTVVNKKEAKANMPFEEAACKVHCRCASVLAGRDYIRPPCRWRHGKYCGLCPDTRCAIRGLKANTVKDARAVARTLKGAPTTFYFHKYGLWLYLLLTVRAPGPGPAPPKYLPTSLAPLPVRM